MLIFSGHQKGSQTLILSEQVSDPRESRYHFVILWYVPALSTDNEALLGELSGHSVSQNSQLTVLEAENDTDLVVKTTVRVQISQGGDTLSLATLTALD